MTGVGGISPAGGRPFVVDRVSFPGASRAEVARGGGTEAPAVGQGPAEGGPATGSFGGLLGRALDELSSLENRADMLTARLAQGEPVELHEVVIATEKAQLALDLAVQLRNRAVEAYQEIMRMPV
ncbi:MAG: flagellar hook-basal body complex protein FliE [Bacillota bacterium]|nr:flagellar hook-basal body complex protein FliE [Bacillota bacterium]